MKSHPSFSQVAIEGQRNEGESVFPLVYGCQDQAFGLEPFLDWVTENRDALLGSATAHGAVAFRGFATPDVEDFDRFIQALEIENFPYKKSLSNAVRVNRTPRVFSANEAPPEVKIFFHHEMAQTPLFPRYILFFCEIAPLVGGATPLCRSDVLYAELRQRCPEFAHKCEQVGLQYTNVMPGVDDPQSGMGRSWQSTLGVETKEQAVSRLAELGYAHEWVDGDCLRATTPRLPAVMEVRPGQKTFFNQLIAAYCGWKDERNDPSDAIRHGDGSKLDPESVAIAIELAERYAYDHKWQKGDIVLLDNTVAMHARRPFEGTRKVVASLAEMQTHAFDQAGV
ncbi:TauD/TfdA family dioxygenase [Roseiconus lacunae]|uniref:TauD/TfdA family dioxygenase n=1 Tax=Roseiconus lacunae TaxID=2605694 RepID=A0ABT7PE14_9BACT|nr:TauD/TfdA family dioxygenase [Roseiconus lacunae]MDM4014743.1 TauD/TfdA family dioxygenase [Roseiconus lacunae]WRQ50333.1 TauD/TfdA family dioxygenase [Stieleria sp. HD01]